MSTRQPLSKSAGILLVLAMTMPLFATVTIAAATPPVTSGQETIANTHYGRTGAPYGDWVKRREPTTFYLHGECSGGSPFGGTGAAALNCEATTHDLQRPPGGFTTRQDVAMTALDLLTFDPTGCSGLPSAAPWKTPQLLQETTVYSVNARFFGELDRQSSTGFLLNVYDLNPDCTVNVQIGQVLVRQVQGSALLVPGEGQLFGGEAVFTGQSTLACDEHDLQRIYGCTLAAGHMLRFTVETVGGNVDDTLCATLFNCGASGFDGDEAITFIMNDAATDSSVGIVSDSVRMNMWTEDRFEKPTDQFLNSSVASIDERRVYVNAAELNTWGGETAGCTITYPDRSLGCPKDNIDQYAMRMRVFDRANERTLVLDQGRGLVYDDASISDSFVGCCNQDEEGAGNILDTTRSIVALTPSAAEAANGMQFFQYRFTYDSKFPDGAYRLEFQDARRLWSVPYNFYVGGGGFDFRFADFEPVSPDLKQANHTVFVQEPTKYQMVLRNDSPSTDTYGISIPVPGLGWTATSTPQTVTLAPHGEAKIEVTVVPPPNARPGDIKVIAVTATSVGQNEGITLFTTTTITAEENYGVDILAPVVQAVETRPSKTELVPLVVANTGTVRNTYVITTSGAPDGWVIGLNPTFMGAYAATREAVILSVTAPAEAVPGFSYTLNVTACPSQKTKGDCDTQFLPIKVYLIDGLNVSVLADTFKDETGFKNVATITSRNIQPDFVDCTLQVAPCLPKGVVLDPSGAFPGDRPIEQTGESRLQDTKFDNSTMFRIRVQNSGDRADRIELTAAWDPDQFGSWDGDGSSDVGGSTHCDGQSSADGVPDGWRFQFMDGRPQFDPGMVVPPSSTTAPRFDPPGASIQFPVPNPPPAGGTPQYGERHTTNPPFSGEMYAGTLTLPAHTSQDVWVSMFWKPLIDDDAGCSDAARDHYLGYDCSLVIILGFNNCTQHSPRAMLRVSYRSQNDESIEGAVRLAAKLAFTDDAVVKAATGHGIEPRNQFAVLMEPAVDQETIGYAPKVGATPYAIYNMLATNTGQQYDQLKITVDEGKDGWTHVLATPPTGSSGTPFGTGIVGTAYTVNNPPGALRENQACTLQTPREMVCTGIGVYDAIAFQARAIPPNGAKVGDTDLMGITVVSQGAQATTGQIVSSTKTVRTFVQGTFGFSIQTPDGLSVNAASPNSASGPGEELHGYPGQTIAVPFTIRNVGLANDRYQVTVEEGDASTTDGDASWNPVLSQGTYVAVPAGLDYHGFLGITIPDDAPETAYIQPETQTDDDDGNGVLDKAGDLVVTAKSEHFRVRVEAIDNPAHQVSTLDIYVPVTPTPLAILSAEAVSIATNSKDAIPLRSDLGADGDFAQVEFDGWYIDALDQFPNLPRGYEWTCLPPDHPHWSVLTPCNVGNEYRVKVNYAAAGEDAKEAINQLEVYVPPNQLGVSRVAHRIWGSSVQGSDRDDSWVDAIINLRSTYGVRLTELDNTTTRVVPPGSLGTGGPTTVFNIVVENAGLTPQSVLLSNSPLPEGWQIFYDSTVATVQPPGFLLENVEDCAVVALCRVVDPQSRAIVQVGLVAPAGALPDDEANVLIFGTVQQDKTQVAQLALRAVVGRFQPEVTTAGLDGLTQDVYIAPQEQARFRVQVTNAGTVTDEIAVTALLPAAVKDFFPVKWDTDCPKAVADETDPAVKTCIVQLAPGNTTFVSLLVDTPDQVVPTGEDDPGYVLSLNAVSLLAPTPVAGSGTATLRILDYASLDVDADGAKEYAIDRNQDATDGYEQFRENLAEAGITTRRLGMENFLSDAAIEKRTTDGRLAFSIHSTCDADGRIDHFLDSDADGLADIFWMPGKRSQAITFVRDTNGDQVSELFLDCEGDGKYDEVYDQASGEFHRLLQRFIDADEYVDYVIDVPHPGCNDPAAALLYGEGMCPPNGEPDKDETVLFGGPGAGIAKIQFNVDMNGDGDIDAVIDSNGDGKPDYWIPFGKVSAIQIRLKDVTGDNVLDWTYDSTGENGEPNAYYDPTTGKSDLIDTKAEFLRDLLGHWYIFVLFGLALVLFVVLVLVTRRR